MFRLTLCASLLMLLVACGPVSAASVSSSAAMPASPPRSLAGSPTVLGDISVSTVWVQGAASPGGAAVAYMAIDNSGPADKLLSVSSDAATDIRLYETQTTDGAVRMVNVPAMVIPEGGQAQLKPGGNHAMMLNITRQLRPGDVLTLILSFERAGTLAVAAVVQQ